VKIITRRIRGLLIDNPVDPSKHNNKCPAIILAVSRMANVKGRINNLIDSINTIKGIRIDGVPWGVKWASKSFK